VFRKWESLLTERAISLGAYWFVIELLAALSLLFGCVIVTVARKRKFQAAT
jgi:hypothetical protein